MARRTGRVPVSAVAFVVSAVAGFDGGRSLMLRGRGGRCASVGVFACLAVAGRVGGCSPSTKVA